MDPVVLELISASLLISALIAYALFRRKEHPLPLPPGPAPFPFLGNVYDMPNEYEWLTYSKWGQTFGPLIHIHLFGKPIIIINSYKIASDLLIRHSTNRPKLTMAGELMGWDLGVALIQGGERHRKYRRMMSKFLGAKVVENYAKDQEKGAVNLVAQLIHSRGAGFDRKVLTMIASGIVRIA
ncbi:hypothetical protein FRC02_008436 [Tulasnella sp. 418]|nr:hypothetical protein FRC02_008436 [Tulasnella sp. 418]